jgi:putative transposase
LLELGIGKARFATQRLGVKAAGVASLAEPTINAAAVDAEHFGDGRCLLAFADGFDGALAAAFQLCDGNRGFHVLFYAAAARPVAPARLDSVTFSCYRQYAFLGRDRTREWLCESLNVASKKFGYQLWAYVVMPEHVHLLIYPGDAPAQMSAFLQAVKEPVARKAIRHLKGHGSEWLARVTVTEGRRVRLRFWQPGGGYDRNITSIETLRSMIYYIHANPVRRGLVSTAEDWEWSSARWYAGLRPVKLEMDENVLTELGMG